MAIGRLLLILGTICAGVGLILVLFVPDAPGRTDMAFIGGGALGIGLGCLL